MDKQKLFADHGLELTSEQIAHFEHLYEVFCDTNSQINLSAIRDEDGIWKKHFLDSILPLKFFNFQGKILDIGTGGGFPALPLSIMTDCEIHGLDSVGKKLKAVSAMADTIGTKIITHHTRCEEAGQDPLHRQQYDTVVSRAVAPWPVLLEYCLPFVKVGGRFIAYQGPQIMDDLDKFEDIETRLGGEIISIVADQICGDERIFIMIEKIKPTPKKYPRDNGVPRLEPLK